MSEQISPLQKIAKAFPVSMKIGFMRSYEFPHAEEYELIEDREGVKFWRKPSSYHPVFEVKDENGVPVYFLGIMPG